MFFFWCTHISNSYLFMAPSYENTGTPCGSTVFAFILVHYTPRTTLGTTHDPTQLDQHQRSQRQLRQY